MKKKLSKSILSIFFIAISFFAHSQTGGVSINKTNTPADPSAMLDVSSTSSPYMGMLIPRMSTANRNSIASPATGLQIFNTDCGINEYYTGTCWISTGQNLKTPDPISCSGTTDFCANETRTFSIPPLTGATAYKWTVPAGASIISGQGTTSATVVFGNNSGEVYVRAENLCESSPNSFISVHINPVPPTPGNITGPTSVAPDNSASYFIASVTGAGVYNWTVPAGATITSGVGTTTITVNFSCNAVSGNIGVAAQSNCGTSSANALAVTVTSVIADAGPAMSAPGAIGGSPTASGGTSPYTYAWLPSSALSSTTVANPTTSLICSTVIYTVTVTDAKGCAASSSTTASNSSPPAIPGLITGNSSFCPNASGVVYSINTVATATSYTWTVPLGASITAGQNSTSITVTFGSSSGNVTVTATNSCGTSNASSKAVTENALPAATFTPTSGTINSAIAFTPTVTGGAYNWAFSNGSPGSSTSQNPSVMWNSTGTYNVILAVTDANNCSSTATTAVTINPPTILSFTNVGTTMWTPPAGVSSVEVLVVAGGGGGGSGYYAGGGGAGGLIYNSSHPVTQQAYTVTVGNGGVGSTTSGIRGSNGENSVFGSLTSVGGGGGGTRSGQQTGNSGGSGGGSSWPGLPGGSGTPGQGNNGGDNFAGGYGSGGGGAGAVGGNGTSSYYGNDGGIGLAYSISGTLTYYAGGGAAGSTSGIDRLGGLGGGGRSSNNTVPSANGTPNTGGGGGGGSADEGGGSGTYVRGGDGGSGIVIIKY